jgi:voltage-gated potassium channel
MNEENNVGWRRIQNKIFRMTSVGVVDVPVNRAYDIITTVALILNICCAFADTYDNLHAEYGNIFAAVELVTVLIFAVDYVLRILTAECLYPNRPVNKAIGKYVFSLEGIVDLLSFLPYFLPFFFPAGAVVFRMFRVVRILRLFRVNAYYDSLNVIGRVLYSKRQQLLSSVFIIMTLMLASSLCMYSLEHDAQPDVFKNAFSGMWWSVSTLLTIGYGDIYPVTPLGQILGMAITFLGVGMVAIPTGIISAGFVEQYQRYKKMGDFAIEEKIQFIEFTLKRDDKWVDKRIMDLGLPHGVIIAVIVRKKEMIVPRGNVVLKAGDQIVVGAEGVKNDKEVELKEIEVRPGHKWNGMMIKEIDLPRHTFIVMVKRNGKSMVAKGNFILTAGDHLMLFSNKPISADEILLGINAGEE